MYAEKVVKGIATFKSSEKHHYPSDSDDDFVKSPTRPNLISPKRKASGYKNESKKKQKCNNDRDSAKKYEKNGKTYLPVNRRHPPKCLIDSIKKFTNAQLERAKNMGFEHVLSLKIEKIPKKLGYWLLTNYDPEKSSLNINGRSLLITREVIHDVYGIPMGGVPIKSFKKSKKLDNVIEEWKRQFVIKQNGRIKVSDVIPKMLEDKEGGRMFQLNFLVLFVTVMIESSSNGPVNQKFLANIEADTVIDNLDWCTYTLDCLNESRKAWNMLDPTNFYTGPLLFLVVFYMKSTMLNGEDSVCGIIPSMNGWTTKQLKDRQSKEVKKGGFGKVAFAPNVLFVEDVGTYDDWGNEEPDDCGDEELNDCGDEEPNDCGDEETSLEDIVNEVNRNFSVIANAKALINENICKGLDLFPNNKDLLTLAK
ncbi:hypothetical protein CTI12_AA434990 [Artemisia annua]|uniref:Ulp1 protease family, C-terminal catalytic domain-containing protein n=1 Tax=Artemisia annua TaxID=35608 RepID=A0A2U1M0R5_ARTAN|nr:hypothetical protein CTI12_AA434990 [Artemisia annua]